MTSSDLGEKCTIEQIPFPMGLRSAPSLELARYQGVADCGFTVVPVVVEFPQQGHLALKLTQQVGVPLLIGGPRLHRELPNEPTWQEVVQIARRRGATD